MNTTHESVAGLPPPQIASAIKSEQRSSVLETASAERRHALLRRLFESPVRAFADPRQTSQQLKATWAEIDGRLSALIGHRGVEALFSRSIHVTRTTAASLEGLGESTDGTVSYGEVASRLSALEPARAREVSLSLLLSFTDLLSSRVGDSLTERLLGPIWTPIEAPPAAHLEERTK